jgi:hypothetical protein
MPPERPDYKSHPLWNEAMALARAAYAVAEEVAGRDPEEARRLRQAAVSVPAKLAGALAAPGPFERDADASQARAALGEVAERAVRLSTRRSSRELARQARDLEAAVRRTLGDSEGLVC